MAFDGQSRVDAIQKELRAAKLDGWLFYDFRASDPLAYGILGLPPKVHATRRWYYWVPAKGTPVKIVHMIERGNLDHLPGERKIYAPWPEQHAHLKATLAKARRIAMQYSPNNAVPYLSRVDAGTIELIRSFGIEIVTSGDLVAQFEAVWTEDQWQSHREVSARLMKTLTLAHKAIATAVRKRRRTTEYEIQQLMMEEFQKQELETSYPPIVAVNANAANPHYGPSESHQTVIKRGDLVLIDFWAKLNTADAVYADYTWMAVADDKIPPRFAELFQIILNARDAGIERVRDACAKGETISGASVDDVVRGVVEKAGYGHAFIHRTGHSIGREVHGNGANIDHMETDDNRTLLPSTCFSIEPGLYLEGDIGFRTEVDVFIGPDKKVTVTGDPIQHALVPLLSVF